MSHPKHPAFERFIQDLRAVWAELPDMAARMTRGQMLLEELVRDESLRQASKSWPSTEGRKNLLFHEDPDYGFAVNGVVRAPGRKGSIHDHAHAWTAYGILDGTESLERFHRIDDGSKEGYARLQLESVTEGGPGKVDLVPPFDVHADKADRHVRSPSSCGPNGSPARFYRVVTTWQTTRCARLKVRRISLTRSPASRIRKKSNRLRHVPGASKNRKGSNTATFFWSLLTA